MRLLADDWLFPPYLLTHSPPASSVSFGESMMMMLHYWLSSSADLPNRSKSHVIQDDDTCNQINSDSNGW